MTALYETAYPQLKSDPSPQELRHIYTPTDDELMFVSRIAKRPLVRTAALMHLKLFQRLGYFMRLIEVPQPIRDHVAKHAGVAKAPTLAELKTFEISGSRIKIVKSLRSFLNVRPLEATGSAWLEQVAQDAAQTKHAVADIINVMLEELVHHRYELPAFSTLDRAAFKAREKSNSRSFAAITSQVSVQAKAMIDSLLLTAPGDAVSGWQMLKREPKRPTNKETRAYLQHLRHLQLLVDQLPKPDVPVPKLKQFRFLARALNAAEMKELKPQKRYALAVIFIRAQHAQSLDDAADLFIRMMQNLENLARQKLLSFQDQRVLKVDMLVSQLRDILGAYRIDGTDTQKVGAIETSLVSDVDALLKDCDEHLAYAGRNHFPFLLQPYKAVRAQLLNCIEIAAPKASSEDAAVEKMLQALQILRANRFDTVPLESLGLSAETDFRWMSAQWRKLVLVKPAAGGKAEVLNRRYYELAVLHEIKDGLKSGDLFVKYGERYDDYREQLVDDQTFEQELAAFGEVTGIETKPSIFVAELQKALLAQAQEVDAGFPTNAHAEIVDGRLILRKPPSSEEIEGVAKVEALVSERLQAVGIVDVLIDTERWLDLHKMFRPLAGTDSRLEDLRLRVITTLFCYGCNLGPVQTAKSIKGLSRRQLSWLNLKYVTEDLLDKANVKVINAYNKFDLPGYWGTGKHVSADGTKWNLYEENLVSEHHIRYGGYGGIGYYHVSDKFVALFSRFISCGTYEGVHILDGLMSNESDIRPDTVHGDTQAQSYPVFALAYLLGIKLMPRIRGIKDLSFFRPATGVTFENIDALFGDPIDWRTIEAHLPAMLRVGVSIKVGKITPSAILRRLGTHSRRNKLYFAFRELGKAIRTIFLLKYIGDVELRKVINAETNKSEQFNAFAHWSFFGGGGVIAENIRHEQRKLVKYNHLVNNMIILHNVVGMTRVLKELRDEGIEITPEVLSGIGPYRVGHINRFGSYTVDFRRKAWPMNFKETIIPTKSNS
ncbi:Tn3 family transposase [Aquabacterium sp.]|uniref:Tn3 family transposase n=1 Tax=Aquabacterium sp. TaxID=1872578 RepID=UPI0019A0436C|nr:Tn3 family transposase [Aquabacterium sp.]MBC7701474.1 Tn3 family transposase [Aquabacterium sp.]